MKAISPKISSQTFAILPSALAEWANTPFESVPAARGDEDTDFYGNSRPTLSIAGGIGYIPISGILLNNPNPVEKGYGAQGYDEISQMIGECESNPSVQGVVFCINSPGGSCTGLQECAATIRGMTKPASVFSNSMVCSAAFMLASQVNGEICLTPGATIGSVGVIAVFANYAAALQNEGVEANVLTSGLLKASGHPAKKMENGERSMLQSLIDAHGTAFRSAVKSKRPTIADDDMQGQVFDAATAVSKGFANRIVGGVQDTLPSDPNQAPGRGRDTLPSNPNRAATDYEAQWASSPELQRRFPAGAKSYAAFQRAEARHASRIPRSLAPAAPLSRPASPRTDAPAGEYEAQWARSAQLQADFPDAKSYAAFKRAEAKGQARRQMSGR